ncbi:MAG: hypothetical protein P1U34_01930 [Coxiellaceae bacterium]|nr:hypothetical protein [Coxiellaceae bacterium]
MKKNVTEVVTGSAAGNVAAEMMAKIQHDLQQNAEQERKIQADEQEEEAKKAFQENRQREARDRNHQRRIERARQRSRSRTESKSDEGRGRRRGRSLNGRDLRKIRSRSQSGGKPRVSFMDAPSPEVRPTYHPQLETEVQYALDFKFKMGDNETVAKDLAMKHFQSLTSDLPEPVVMEKLLHDALILEGVVYTAQAIDFVSKALCQKYIQQRRKFEAGDVDALPAALPVIFHHNYRHVYLPNDLTPQVWQQCKKILVQSGESRIISAISEMKKVLGTDKQQYAFQLVLCAEAKYYRAKQNVPLVDPQPLTPSEQVEANAYCDRAIATNDSLELFFADVLFASGYDVCREVVSQYYRDRYTATPTYADSLFAYVDIPSPVLEMYRNQVRLNPLTAEVISHNRESWRKLASERGGFAKLLAAISERRRLALDVMPKAPTPDPTPMPPAEVLPQTFLSKQDVSIEDVEEGVVSKNEIQFSSELRKLRKSLRRRSERAIRALASYNDVRGASLAEEKKPALRLMNNEARLPRNGCSNHYHVMRHGVRPIELNGISRGGKVNNSANFYPLIISCLKKKTYGKLHPSCMRDGLAEDLLKNPRNYYIKFIATNASGQAVEEWQLMRCDDNCCVYEIDAVSIQKCNRISHTPDMLEVNTLRQLVFHSLLSRTFDISRRGERPVMRMMQVQQQSAVEENKATDLNYEAVSVASLRAGFMSLVTNKDPTSMARIFPHVIESKQQRAYLPLDETSDSDSAAPLSFALRIGDKILNQEFFGIKETSEQLQSYFDTELLNSFEDSESRWLRVLALQYVFYDLSKILEMQIRRRIRFIETVNAANKSLEDGVDQLDWSQVDGILQANHPLALPGLEGGIDEQSKLFAAMKDTIAKMNIIQNNIHAIASYQFSNSNLAIKSITAARYVELCKAMGAITSKAKQKITSLKDEIGYSSGANKKTWQQIKDLQQQAYCKYVGRSRRNSNSSAVVGGLFDPTARDLNLLAFDKLINNKLRHLKSVLIKQGGILQQVFDSSYFGKLENRLDQLISEYHQFKHQHMSPMTMDEIARANYVTLGMKKVDMICRIIERLTENPREEKSLSTLTLSHTLKQLQEIDNTEYDITLMNAKGRLVELKGFHFNRHRHGDKRDQQGVTIPIRSLSSARKFFGSTCCCINTTTRKPLSRFINAANKILRKSQSEVFSTSSLVSS